MFLKKSADFLSPIPLLGSIAINRNTFLEIILRKAEAIIRLNCLNVYITLCILSQRGAAELRLTITNSKRGRFFYLLRQTIAKFPWLIFFTSKVGEKNSFVGFRISMA